MSNVAERLSKMRTENEPAMGFSDMVVIVNSE